MAQSVYQGLDTYVIFAEEAVFGTAVAPSGSRFWDKVTSFSHTTANNQILIQGIGDGRNATSNINGIMDVTGSIEWDVTDLDIFQYCFVAERSGAGTAGDPFEIQERDRVGFTSGSMPTITFERGSEGGANDDVLQFDGVVINTVTLNVPIGEKVTATAEWIGRQVTSSTTVETYTGPTNRPFTFVDGELEVNGNTVAKLQNVSLTCNNNVVVYRAIGDTVLGSRGIQQPVPTTRRYEFSMALKLSFDDGASIESGLEMRGLVFTGVNSATSPSLTGAQNTSATMNIKLVEGASSGDRDVTFQFEDVFFNDYSEPIAVEDGVIEITITGTALAGLTDGAEKVPLTYFTVA